MAGFTSTLLALGTFQLIALFTFVGTFAILAITYLTRTRYPDYIPRVREPENATRFSLKTRLAYYTECEQLYKEAYEQYSKHGKTCLVPGIGLRDEVMLAPSALQWAATQPDSKLSVYEGFVAMDQAEYLLGDAKYVRDPWQGQFVKRDMNAVLETLAAALNDELQYAFAPAFGTHTKEWRDIEMYSAMKRVVAQASSRFTVGLPLCRDERYLGPSTSWVFLYVPLAGAILGLPDVLKPILGPLIALPIKYYFHLIKRSLTPTYQSRLPLLSSPKSASTEPLDHLQMILRYASTDLPSELNLHDITSRVAASNLGAYLQTTMAVTQILYNILDSDTEYNTLSLLRQEIDTVLARNNNQWSKATVAQLVKCDSVCRETLRLQSFGNRAVIRKVMINTLRTDDGILLPKGALTSMFTYHSATDTSLIPDGKSFDPFRFSRIREQEDGGGDEGKRQSLVSLGAKFLPFGYGKHACPGRFLVDFELKMILAFVVRNYEIRLPAKYAGKRPKVRWMAEAMLPPSGGMVGVRRREGTVGSEGV